MLSIESFINDKLKSYLPPEKEGVPRGERIGFPLKKYHASLLLLSMDSIKDIAKEVKAPYGSVRNWKTEKEFSELTKKNADEFAEIFVKTLESKKQKRQHEMIEIFKKPLEEMADLLMSELDIKESMDVKNYSCYLYTQLVSRIVLDILMLLGSFLKILGMGKTEWSKAIDAIFSEGNGEHITNLCPNLNKYKEYTSERSIKSVTSIISRFEELSTGVSMLMNLKDTKEGPKKSSKKNEVEVLKMEVSELIRSMSLRIIMEIFLQKNPMKKNHRKLAVYLLTRMMQSAR